MTLASGHTWAGHDATMEDYLLNSVLQLITSSLSAEVSPLSSYAASLDSDNFLIVTLFDIFY